MCCNLTYSGHVRIHGIYLWQEYNLYLWVRSLADARRHSLTYGTNIGYLKSGRLELRPNRGSSTPRLHCIFITRTNGGTIGAHKSTIRAIASIYQYLVPFRPIHVALWSSRLPGFLRKALL